jgi:hypothetical protein
VGYCGVVTLRSVPTVAAVDLKATSAKLLGLETVPVAHATVEVPRATALAGAKVALVHARDREARPLL